MCVPSGIVTNFQIVFVTSSGRADPSCNELLSQHPMLQSTITVFLNLLTKRNKKSESYRVNFIDPKAKPENVRHFISVTELFMEFYINAGPLKKKCFNYDNVRFILYTFIWCTC